MLSSGVGPILTLTTQAHPRGDVVVDMAIAVAFALAGVGGGSLTIGRRTP